MESGKLVKSLPFTIRTNTLVQLSLWGSKMASQYEREIKYKYAEEWLDKGVAELRLFFKKRGHQVPEVLVSVGFSHHGWNPKRKYSNYAGYCNPSYWSKDGKNEIYISPINIDDVDLIFLLAHELIHAVDNCRSGHGDRFKSIARDLGMIEGGEIPKEVYDETCLEFSKIYERLGRYPRSGVNYVDSLQIPNPNSHKEVMEYRQWQSNKMKGYRVGSD
jgi:hypothetical protein